MQLKTWNFSGHEKCGAQKSLLSKTKSYRCRSKTIHQSVHS